MKITVLSVGTRGDIQPYVALGMGLQNAGHEVTLGMADYHEAFIRAFGLRYVPLNFPAHYPLRPLLADCTAALEGADVVVAGLYPFLLATPYCEAHGIRLSPAFLQTLNVRLNFMHPSTPALDTIFLPASTTKNDSGQRIDYWHTVWKTVNMNCREAGLRPTLPPTDFVKWITHGQPVLYGFSPSVVPPSDLGIAPGHITGYWFLDLVKDFVPSPALCDFIESGPPPVHIGFGSLLYANLVSADIILEALKHTGQRAVMIRNVPNLDVDALPSNVFLIDDAPYEWLFPRCSASVNHAGHGTIAHALQAGTPCVTIPTIFDQPYWAQRVYELGAGTKPLAALQLTVESLSEAIMQAVEDTEIRSHATALSQCIRAEDGVGHAIRLLTNFLG